VNVDLSSKPRWFSRVNPAGLVPAVAWQGLVQTESLDICRLACSFSAFGPLTSPPPPPEWIIVMKAEQGK